MAATSSGSGGEGPSGTVAARQRKLAFTAWVNSKLVARGLEVDDVASFTGTSSLECHVGWAGGAGLFFFFFFFFFLLGLTGLGVILLGFGWCILFGAWLCIRCLLGLF